MEIEEVRYANAVILRPKERIDQSTAEAFQSRLLEAVGGDADAVVVDFSDVEYISSVGLRAIMIAAKTGKSENVSIGVSDLQPAVNEIFEISRFNLVVTVFETLREGVAAASDEALAAFEAG